MKSKPEYGRQNPQLIRTVIFLVVTRFLPGNGSLSQIVPQK